MKAFDDRAPLAVLTDFKLAHQHLLSGLAALEAITDAGVLSDGLRRLRHELLTHLDRKDAFYDQLLQLSTANGDAGAASLAKVFLDNMRVQAAAIRKFMEGLDAPAGPQLVASFRTIHQVLRSRLPTEERAVFPLYEKQVHKGGN